MKLIAPLLLAVLLVCTGCAQDTPIAIKPAWTTHHGGVIRGDTSRKQLALIFTGGDKGEGSQHILDTLKANRAHASFFVTGAYLEQPGYDAYLTRMVSEGHYLGPHSQGHLLYAPWDNREKSLVTEAQFKQDLKANIDALRAYGCLPIGKTIYFIPPYEWYNAQHADWAGDLGCLLFNFTPGSGSHRDWAPRGHAAFRSSTQILSDILTHEAASPNGISGHLLLLHLGGERKDKMYRLLDELIKELKARGYRFVRVDELLD